MTVDKIDSRRKKAITLANSGSLGLHKITAEQLEQRRVSGMRRISGVIQQSAGNIG